jgi:hypothetical protein
VWRRLRHGGSLSTTSRRCCPACALRLCVERGERKSTNDIYFGLSLLMIASTAGTSCRRRATAATRKTIILTIDATASLGHMAAGGGGRGKGDVFATPLLPHAGPAEEESGERIAETAPLGGSERRSVFFYSSQGEITPEMFSEAETKARLAIFVALARSPELEQAYVDAVIFRDWGRALGIERGIKDGALEDAAAILAKAEDVEIGLASAFVRVHDLPIQDAEHLLGYLTEHANLLAAVICTVRRARQVNPVIIQLAPRLRHGDTTAESVRSSSFPGEVEKTGLGALAAVFFPRERMPPTHGGRDAEAMASGALRLLFDEYCEEPLLLRILFLDAGRPLHVPSLVSDSPARWVQNVTESLRGVLCKEGIRESENRFTDAHRQWFVVVAWAPTVFRKAVSLMEDYGRARDLFSGPATASALPEATA